MRVLVATVIAAVLLAGGGLAAARFVKSPNEKAAEAKAPAPSVITAMVERRILTDTVVLRGQVTAGQSLAVSPRVSAAGGKDSGGAKPVVTGLRVKPGDVLRAGQILIEVSGRPVFVLPGDVPVYRDLKPGSEGRDVAQLQSALDGLGHKTGTDKSGTYGPGTKGAVASFYKSLGYDPPAAGEGDDQALRAAQDRVTTTERALAQARDALKAGPPSGSTTPPTGPGGSGASGGTGATPAPGTNTRAEQQVRYATEDLARAKNELAALKAKSGAMLPAGEVLFLSRFPARVDTVQAQVGSEVKERALTVSTGDLVVKGRLAPHEKGLVQPRLKVRILSELTGIEAEGEVRSVADTPSDPSGDIADSGDSASSGRAAAPQAPGQGYEMVVVPSKALDAKLAGQDVRLTVEAASSGGPVLVVPISAVSAGADGRTVLTVVDPSGTQRRTEIRPGTSGDGYVEVTPLSGESVHEGDRVVVGAARKDTAGGTGGTVPAGPRP
ncbi:peptidoglycan-binding protein [Embleya sp. NPDC056575]|uniref:peptidoglycan-binding protein n=1 Tax=unclassified Embleya TaxID=2699296 RepID=UPI00368F020C